MGANFQTMTLDGTMKRAELRDAFAEVQERDRYENGHSYSGGFGMASGLLVESREPFSSENDASEWLADNCEKWEQARAVTVRKPDGQLLWVIGAWCSS